MTRHVLIVRNTKLNLQPSLDRAAEYFKRKAGIETQYHYLDTELFLWFKDFNVLVNGISYWGLNGIKEQLRQTGKIPRGKYHEIIFCYDLPQNFDKPHAAWTYPNDLQLSAFSEVPCSQSLIDTDVVYRHLTHEPIHAWNRLAQWKGLTTNDTMDQYDNELDPESPTGNRARNLQFLALYLKEILSPPLEAQIITLQEKAIGLLTQFLNYLKNLKSPVKKNTMRIITDDMIAQLNIWMEARSEPFEGKVAVAEVMLNRLKKGSYGKTITDVVLAPYQFSGWNTKDPNRIKAMKLDDTDSAYLECARAWQTAKTGTNFAKGALLYYNPRAVEKDPIWATSQNFLITIGNHNFYSE
jgi:N-acetylmuramoyl-L-alanine amidase